MDQGDTRDQQVIKENNGPEIVSRDSNTIFCMQAVDTSMGFGSSHGILLRPAAGCRLVLGPIRLVHVGNLGNKGIIRVGIGQQGTDREQDLYNIKTSNRSIMDSKQFMIWLYDGGFWGSAKLNKHALLLALTC